MAGLALVSIPSLGRRAVGRAGLTGESSAPSGPARGWAVPGLCVPHPSLPWEQPGGHPQPGFPPPGAAPLLQQPRGWERDGSSGEDFGLSPHLLRCLRINRLLISLCPYSLWCGGLGQSFLQGCPVILPDARKRGQAPGLAPCLHAALGSFELILSTTNLFFHNTRGKGADKRLQEHYASLSPVSGLRSSPAALHFGTVEPKRCLHLHRRLISVAGEGTPIMNQAHNSQHTYFQSPVELLILAAPWGREDGGGNVTLWQESCDRQPSQPAPSWRWLLVSRSLRWTMWPHN